MFVIASARGYMKKLDNPHADERDDRPSSDIVL